MRTGHKKIIAVSVGLALILGSLGGCKPIQQSRETLQAPEMADDGWITESPGDAGMDEGLLLSLASQVTPENGSLHSILIVKDGKLVFEKYSSGEDLKMTSRLEFIHKDFDRDTLHCLASASKSVTSILFGIAEDEGAVPDIQAKLFGYFPEYSELDDPSKQGITLEELLTMSSGVPWDESYSYDDPRNDLNQMYFSTDPIGNYLERKVSLEPGTEFVYNSGSCNIIGEIIRRATGETLLEYANEKLFSPLGIKGFSWSTFPFEPKMALASSLLYLTPREMAKIGQLCLQKGTWQGKRVVSEAWIDASTKISIHPPPADSPIPQIATGYGYFWWVGEFPDVHVKAYFAAGFGGQFIFVLPELNTVVVMTGGSYGQESDEFYHAVNDYVIPSISGVSSP